MSRGTTAATRSAPTPSTTTAEPVHRTTAAQQEQLALMQQLLVVAPNTRNNNSNHNNQKEKEDTFRSVDYLQTHVFQTKDNDDADSEVTRPVATIATTDKEENGDDVVDVDNGTSFASFATSLKPTRSTSNETNDFFKSGLFQSGASLFKSGSDLFKSGSSMLFRSNSLTLVPLPWQSRSTSDTDPSVVSSSAVPPLVPPPMPLRSTHNSRSTSQTSTTTTGRVRSSVPTVWTSGSGSDNNHSSTTTTTLRTDVFDSSAWTPKLAPTHVDVDYGKVQGELAALSTVAAAAVPLTVPHPTTRDTAATTADTTTTKARRGRKRQRLNDDDDDDTYVDPDNEPTPTRKRTTPTTTTSSSKKRARPKRKTAVKDEDKQFIADSITDLDVLLGRGGRTNHHKGNATYLVEKLLIQPRYMAAEKPDKTAISQELVDVIVRRGGRFLKLDEATQQWYQVDNTTARKKASQTLRETNTPEVRQQKRLKYGRK